MSVKPKNSATIIGKILDEINANTNKQKKLTPHKCTIKQILLCGIYFFRTNASSIWDINSTGEGRVFPFDISSDPMPIKKNIIQYTTKENSYSAIFMQLFFVL